MKFKKLESLITTKTENPGFNDIGPNGDTINRSSAFPHLDGSGPLYINVYTKVGDNKFGDKWVQDGTRDVGYPFDNGKGGTVWLRGDIKSV